MAAWMVCPSKATLPCLWLDSTPMPTAPEALKIGHIWSHLLMTGVLNGFYRWVWLCPVSSEQPLLTRWLLISPLPSDAAHASGLSSEYNTMTLLLFVQSQTVKASTELLPGSSCPTWSGRPLKWACLVCCSSPVKHLCYTAIPPFYSPLKVSIHFPLSPWSLILVSSFSVVTGGAVFWIANPYWLG